MKLPSGWVFTTKLKNKGTSVEIVERDLDDVIAEMEEKKLTYGYEFNRGIDACIAILRGLEK